MSLLHCIYVSGVVQKVKRCFNHHVEITVVYKRRVC